MLWNINARIIGPRLIFSSDESWFHLHGHVSTQDNRHWRRDKAEFIHENALHDHKNGVWYDMHTQ